MQLVGFNTNNNVLVGILILYVRIDANHDELRRDRRWVHWLDRPAWLVLKVTRTERLPNHLGFGLLYPRELKTKRKFN